MPRKQSKPVVWAYVVAFDGDVDRDIVIEALAEYAVDWYSCMANTLFVQSDHVAETLADVLIAALPVGARFIVLDAKTDRQGRLPDKAWRFLNLKT